MVDGLGIKILDYLALGKPKICLVRTESVIASELGAVPTVVITHPRHTPDRIAAALEAAFGLVGTPCRADLDRYSHSESTRQLARLLDDIAT